MSQVDSDRSIFSGKPNPHITQAASLLPGNLGSGANRHKSTHKRTDIQGGLL
jgi:hypothetical protein